jgi:hypothetical protein
MNKLYTLLLCFGGFGSLYAQNTCATALPASVGLYTVAAIDGSDVPAPICAPNGAGATAGEWYAYTPSQNYTVTVSTDLAQNGTVDTRVHIYSGSCGSLVCVGGDDDSGTNYLSIASFPALVGNTYYIAFDNRWSSNGFDFQITEGPYVEPITAPVEFTAVNVPTIAGAYKIAVVDMNGDFLDDIVSVDGNEIQIHYQQVGGGFSETTYITSTPDFLPTWSLAAGDIDKNGFNDIVYGGGSGVTFMYANSTGTGFTEVSGSEYVFSQRSNMVDINNDGHLDVFVCHDVDPNVYYINNGSGILQFNQGGIGDHSEGGNYGSIWTDYDNDGDVDLFIAKCRGGASTAKINELHRNNGNGTFTNVSVASNMSDPLQTWSSAWNDYDNDGWMDALIGASSTEDGPHKLMRNNGDGTFDDITAGSGWDVFTPLNIEHISYDFDNDGFADVFGGGNDIMFNNGDLTFSPSEYAMTNGPVGDLNNDGFLDIQNGNTIYYNDGNDNNWVKINLQGVQSNSNGIGARVTIYGDWGQQIRDIRSGEGFRYMNTLNAHFGIGAATEIDSIYIQWPSGHIDVVPDPTINTSHVVVEGTNGLGLLNVDGLNISIFPNPTSDFVTIENFASLKGAKIEIITHTGAFVQDLTSAQTSVKHLASGLYILRVQLPDGRIFADRFIKN